MITVDLISYIKRQQLNNKSKENIVSNLLRVGWHQSDIEEGFLNIENELKQKIILEEKKEISNANANENIEIFNLELPARETTKAEVRPAESPKVWTPMAMPVKEPSKTIDDLNIKTPIIKKEEVKNEDLIPNLIPKPAVNPFEHSGGEVKVINNTGVGLSRTSLNSNLPKSAMIASYGNDLLSANQQQQEVVKKKSKNLFKWYIIGLALILVAFLVWVFIGGYFNIKNINLSFVKKDPKILLLNNSKTLSALSSYKTETQVEILSPSFADISTGLINGEAVNSQDKDSISIMTLGMINQNEGKILSDNNITIKSSLLQSDIITDVKNDGLDLFIQIPDLSQIIKENTPDPVEVKINEQQFDLIPALFSGNLGLELKKINIYKIISSGMPSFINNETLGVYNEFINNIEIVDKGQEKIKDVETYHYSVITDRQSSKKLLSKIYENFILNNSEEDKIKLNEILGSTTITSFDVWVGKSDNNIYQYNVVLTVPLSKIIGFEDKSIGDNVVTFNWKTTYYDFNIANEILIPEISIPVTTFINSIKEAKLKNEVSSFEQLATDLSLTEKSFGSKSNVNGSCMNPTAGSLFSPTGHKKDSTLAISAISELLNKVMGTTYGAGFCYSNSKAWSFTIPISDDYDPFSPTVGEYKSYYCVDNTGTKKDLVTPPTGVICK